MTEVEAFLANQKRYNCVKLCAALTIEQCKANKAREAVTKKAINDVIQCKGCPGLNLTKPVTAIAKGGDEMSKSEAVYKICLKCGLNKKHHGRGLCPQCYNKTAMEGKISDFPPIVRPGTYSPRKAVHEKPIIITPPAALRSALPQEEIKEFFSGIEVQSVSVSPMNNPLLSEPSQREIVLNLEGEADLYTWLIENEIKPDHIINLLNVSRCKGLRVAA